MVIGGLNELGCKIVAGFVKGCFGAPFGIEQTENALFYILVIPVIICIPAYTEFFDNFLDSVSTLCMGMDHFKSSFDFFR